MITAGDRLTYAGDQYQLPLAGGEGKPLRSAASPVHVPIYVASLGPANLRLISAAADGWIGNSFFCDPGLEADDGSSGEPSVGAAGVIGDGRLRGQGAESRDVLA